MNDGAPVSLAVLDPALPDLGVVRDLATVRRAFAERWPGRRGRFAPRVVDAELRRITFRPGRGVVACYGLLVHEPGASPRRTLGVVEVTGDGWTHRLYEDDPVLRALAVAGDGAAMAERFSALVAGPVDRCAVEPVSYRPGEHCVLRYELWPGPAAGGSTVLFGKVCPDRAASLTEVLTALSRLGGHERGFEVGRPAACFADLGMVVLPAAGGRSFRDIVGRPSVPKEARQGAAATTGRALAGLHDCAGPPGPQQRLADDVDELRAGLPVVALADEGLAGRIDGVLAQLDAADGPAGPSAPGHGSFRADHVVLDGDRAELIDLDGYGWSEPARDVGNLLAYLRWKARREPQHAATLAEARSRFLEGYTSVRGLDEERCAVYEAAAAVKIAIRRFRTLTVAEWPLVPRLVDAAADVLGRDRPVGAS